MLCTALVTGPELLFLDEPTSGLDVQSAKLIRQTVIDLNRRGLTVFLTIHNMSEAGEMCSRVAIIDKGCIVAIDCPENFCLNIKAGKKIEQAGGKESHDFEKWGAKNHQKTNRYLWSIEQYYDFILKEELKLEANAMIGERYLSHDQLAACDPSEMRQRLAGFIKQTGLRV